MVIPRSAGDDHSVSGCKATCGQPSTTAHNFGSATGPTTVDGFAPHVLPVQWVFGQPSALGYNFVSADGTTTIDGFAPTGSMPAACQQHASSMPGWQRHNWRSNWRATSGTTADSTGSATTEDATGKAPSGTTADSAGSATNGDAAGKGPWQERASPFEVPTGRYCASPCGTPTGRHCASPCGTQQTAADNGSLIEWAEATSLL